MMTPERMRNASEDAVNTAKEKLSAKMKKCTEATDEIKDILGSWKPNKKPPTYREFSRQIKLPAGPMMGQYYDPSSDPVQSWLLDQIDSDRWSRISICGAPQVSGKTLVAILTPALRDMIKTKSPVGYGLPTLADLDKAWTEKLKPAIVGSGFGEYLPKSGAGSKGGRGQTLTLFDPRDAAQLGRIVFLAGSSYSSTVKTILVDEVDQFRKKNGEPMWEVLEDMAHRADSYGDKARRIYAGTIEDDNESIILTLIDEQGTGTRVWPQCPHCGTHQRFLFENFKYDASDEETAANTARLACTHCGVLMGEDDRQRGLRHALFCHEGQTVNESGQIIGAAPKTRSLGLLWTALDASLASMAELAVEHYRAQQAIDNRAAHGLMRKFARYRECRLYTDDIDNIANDTKLCTTGYLFERAQRYGCGVTTAERGDGYSSNIIENPPECIKKTALAADIQGDRIYWSIIGLGDNYRTYDLGYGYEYLEFGEDEKLVPFGSGDVAKILDRIAEKDFPIPPSVRVVDTGFDPMTGELIDYLRTHKHTWSGIRGTSRLPKSVVVTELEVFGWSKKWATGVGRWFIRTDLAQQRVHQMYLARFDAAGAAFLPNVSAARNAYIKHLSAWQMIDGKWKQLKARDDWLDCRAYATAMLLWANPPKKQKTNRTYGRVAKL